MAGCISPVEGITGAYTGNSFAVQASLASLLGCAFYSCLELIVLIFIIFNVYRGLYFWSLIVSTTLGVVPYALGLCLKYFELSPLWLSVTLITGGWCFMVTGQALVLYSRLHLVVYNQKILRCVLGMIIFNAIAMQMPQLVASYGSIYACQSHFIGFFEIWQRVQLVMFFLQETIISSIFIVATIKLLRLYPTLDKQRLEIMYQLLAINSVIILMNISLLVLQLLGLFITQTALKCFFYTVKLKLEIAVLSRLALIVQSHALSRSSGLSFLTE